MNRRDFLKGAMAGAVVTVTGPVSVDLAGWIGALHPSQPELVAQPTSSSTALDAYLLELTDKYPNVDELKVSHMLDRDCEQMTAIRRPHGNVEWWVMDRFELPGLPLLDKESRRILDNHARVANYGLYEYPRNRTQ